MAGAETVNGGSERFGSLDGLRGAAILSVVFLHWIVRPFKGDIQELSSQLYRLLNQTAHGVDIFFVISGFLIGRILLTNADRPGFLQTFYVRRFFRIVPLYFAVIWLLLAARLSFGGYPEGAVPTVTYFVFVNNLGDALGWKPIPEFGPYWSLAIEEQFYLISALIAVSVGRRGVILLGTCFVIGSIGFRLLNYIVPTGIGWWPFTMGHSDPIGIGLLVAAALTSSRASRLLLQHVGWIKIVAILSVVGFFATSWFRSAEILGLDIALVSTAVACWIVVKLLDQPESLLAFGPMRRLGEMCFSLYILHEGWQIYITRPLFAFGLPREIAIAVSFGLLIAAGRLLWVYVETPLIAYGRRWRYDFVPPVLTR